MGLGLIFTEEGDFGVFPDDCAGGEITWLDWTKQNRGHSADGVRFVTLAIEGDVAERLGAEV